MTRISPTAVLLTSALSLLAQSTQPSPTLGGIGGCNSSASAPAGVVLSCPQGDGDALGAAGLTITVIVRNDLEVPMPGVPASDVWVTGCDGAHYHHGCQP